ncbi:FmdB family zinc ribbon protein [Legionella saoudiensis]|uniref:FmdB family zinc ribbon protein n=1 Tax=Legionella saoudiensis TaxID=1750561 RepID=UPI00072FD9F4|nr:zinc ribbon domain-containing protein [Legionella saoudiensis]
MPIYEYQCTNCHHHFDLMQKISDEPVKQCPECGKNTVIKLISAAGFQLKGTGWYATDFKDKSSTSPTTSTSKETTPAKADSDTKSTSTD